MIKIYHNPRCSKSRQTLALLEESGASSEVVEYLNTPLSKEDLQDLVAKLNMPVQDIVRKKEAKDLGLDLKTIDTEALISEIVTHPILIERPIVVTDKGARICRPPETVHEIL